MSDYTFGPWSPESPNGNIRANVPQPRSGQPVNTHLFFACTANGTTPQEREANARLVAASPDLLQACVAALSTGALEHGGVADILRSAIAKATGGAS